MISLFSALVAATYRSLLDSASFLAVWVIMRCLQRGECGWSLPVFLIGHGLGLPPNISGVTIILLVYSFLRFVCLPEKTSASMTTFDSNPFDPCMVIILTASFC